MAPHASGDAMDVEETQRLLIPAPAPAASAPTREPASPKGKNPAPTEAPLKETASVPMGVCRICLEEDLVSNLEEPCACTGTQRHAHHACIQRWVDEKGNAKCEICEQPYRGGFTVPPPVPPELVFDGSGLPLFAPMYILEAQDPRSAAHRARLELIDADTQMYHHGLNVPAWALSFMVFFMLLVVIHSNMIVSDEDMARDDGGAGAGGYGPGGGPGGDMDDGDDYASSFTLFMLWVLAKFLLIGIPLWTVMRIAARQARREQYEALLRAGAAYQAARRAMVFPPMAGNMETPGPAQHPHPAVASAV